MSCHRQRHLTAINNYVGRIGQELLLLRLRTNNHLWHGIAPFLLRFNALNALDVRYLIQQSLC